MSTRTPVRKGRAILVATLILAPVLFALAAPARADPMYQEDWANGLAGWTVTGGGTVAQCPASETACRLTLAPGCCAEGTSVSRTLSIPLTGLTRVALSFQGSAPWGNTDTNLEIGLTNGSVVLHPSDYGTDENNGMSLGTTATWDRTFFSWGQTATWYTVHLYLDPGQQAAWAEVLSATGTALATSEVVPLNPGSDAITSVTFSAITWQGGPAPTSWSYGPLRIEPATLNRPLPPASLDAAPRAYSIALTWSPSTYGTSPPVAAYRVYHVLGEGVRELLATVTESMTFTHTGLGVGERHVYQVTAVDTGGRESPPSRVERAWSATVPSPPAIWDEPLSTPDSIVFTWETPYRDGGSPVTAYRVYREAPGSPLSLIGETDASTRTYEDATGAPGTEYTYRVSAVNAVGESAISYHRVTVASGAPAAPTLLSAEMGSHSAALTWDPPANPGTTPIVEYLVGASPEGEDGYWDEVSTTETQFTIDWLDNNVKYRFRVRAVNLVGAGAPSELMTGIPHVTARPENLTATAAPDARVALTWSAVPDDKDGPIAYVVYRSTDLATWTAIGEAPIHAHGWRLFRSPVPIYFVDDDPMEGVENAYYVVARYESFWGIVYDGPASDIATVPVPGSTPLPSVPLG